MFRRRDVAILTQTDILAKREEMKMRKLSIATLAVAMLAVAGPASAETPVTACRASVVRVGGEGPLAALGTREPLVANPPYIPCAEGSTPVRSLSIPFGAGRITAEVVHASTDAKPVIAASASLSNVVITHPMTGAPWVGASLIASTATCNPETGEIDGSRDVVGLQVLGVPVSVPPAGIVNLGDVIVTADDPDAGGANSIDARAISIEGTFGEIVLANSQAAC